MHSYNKWENERKERKKRFKRFQCPTRFQRTLINSYAFPNSSCFFCLFSVYPVLVATVWNFWWLNRIKCIKSGGVRIFSVCLIRFDYTYEQWNTGFWRLMLKFRFQILDFYFLWNFFVLLKKNWTIEITSLPRKFSSVKYFLIFVWCWTQNFNITKLVLTRHKTIPICLRIIYEDNIEFSRRSKFQGFSALNQAWNELKLR